MPHKKMQSKDEPATLTQQQIGNYLRRLYQKKRDELLSTVSLTERNAITLRLGLGDGNERTYEAVGKSLGCTKEGARKITVRGLNKLEPEIRYRLKKSPHKEYNRGVLANRYFLPRTEQKGIIKENFFTKLSKREQRVLALRYGLNGKQNYTYKQIGELEGITTAGAEKLIKRTLKKLNIDPPGKVGKKDLTFKLPLV